MVLQYVCLLNAVKIGHGPVAELLALVESGWRSARGDKGEMPKAIQIVQAMGRVQDYVLVLFDRNVSAYIASEQPSTSADASGEKP